MLKSISIHPEDNKGIVRSNFVTPCLAFKGSIPTKTTLLVAWFKMRYCPFCCTMHNLSTSQTQVPIPEWKCEHIIMNFVFELPKYLRGNNATWVIFYRLTKLAHFLPI